MDVPIRTEAMTTGEEDRGVEFYLMDDYKKIFREHIFKNYMERILTDSFSDLKSAPSKTEEKGKTAFDMLKGSC